MKKKIIAIGIIILFLGICNIAAGFSPIRKYNAILPTIMNNNPLYEQLEPGDITICLSNKTYGHCRIFTGYNSTTNRYTFIESYYKVIKYDYTLFGLMAMAWFTYESMVIIKVNATLEQKQNAIDFAERQVGKKFHFLVEYVGKNHNPEDKWDFTANRFYCSELVWAAYYNCNNSFPKTKPSTGYKYGEGIDIDYNGYEKDRGSITKFAFVHPKDIVKDDDVQVIEIWKR